MKRLLLLLFVSLASLQSNAQISQYTSEDVMHFYMTLQGDYSALMADSSVVTLHLTPIWESTNGSYHWLYLEAVNQETQSIVEQKIVEIVPLSNITFNVVIYKIKHPKIFAGKWSNPSFFDGYNSHILKGKSKFLFLKTGDYDYQTSWNRRKSLKCFPSGDLIHFKFIQEDERFYIKRLLAKSSKLEEIVFFKDPSD